MTQSVATKKLLYAELSQVFIQRGYDGATLSHLAAAAGLSKASLYHHFPGGKSEMAMVLLRNAITELQQSAFSHLAGSGNPKKRLLAFINGFAQYTQDGARDCLLAVLSHHLTAGEETAPHRAAIAAQFTDWQAALSHTFEADGAKPKKAMRLARELLAALYGALLLGKMHNQPELFISAVRRLRKDTAAA